MSEPTEPTGTTVFEEVAPITVAEIDTIDAEWAVGEEQRAGVISRAEQRLANLRLRADEAEQGLFAIRREAREARVGLNARKDETAKRLLLAEAPELANRSTDECYRIFAAWSHGQQEGEERLELFSNLVNLREAFGEITQEQPRLVVIRYANDNLQRIIVAETPPVIGISDKDSDNALTITLGSNVVIDNFDAIGLLDQEKNRRAFEQAKTISAEDLARVEVIESAFDIPELRIGALELRLENGRIGPKQVVDLLNARAILGLSNDSEMVKRILESLLRRNEAGKAMLALSKMIAAPTEQA